MIALAACNGEIRLGTTGAGFDSDAAPASDAGAPSCADDVRCPDATPICATGDVCVECTDADDCNGNRFCNPGGSCVDCLSDTDCHPGTPLCNPANGRCVKCVSDADCPPGTPSCDPTTAACVAK